MYISHIHVWLWNTSCSMGLDIINIIELDGVMFKDFYILNE